MNLNITTNLAEVRSRLSGLEKQVNFAASKALNDTAREERKTVRCVECVNWSLRDAPVEVARYGFGVCKAAAPKTPWRHLGATCDRECSTWARTGEEIVRERMQWLMRVWEMARKEIEA